jgi:predicted nucleic acid-binding protein
MRKYVLDANALLAYLGQRPAASRVAGLLREAARCEQPLLMSVVNWGEVLHAVWTESGEDSARRLAAGITGLPVTLWPASAEDAFDAARLKAVHKLPYADSFAAGLALRERAIIVTSDPHFERLGKQVAILWLN